MKKALSILLSVMMVAGLFIALIPTATAAMVEAPEVEKGKLLYSNDFESLDSSLTDYDLVETLAGAYISGPMDSDLDGYGDNYTGSVSFNPEKGYHLLVGTNAADGSKALSYVSAGQDWLDLVLFASDDLAGGDYILEYDVAFDSSHIQADNAPDYVSSSGMSFGFATGFHGGSGKKYPSMYLHYGIKSRGEADMHIAYPGVANAGKGDRGAANATADKYCWTDGSNSTSIYALTRGADAMMKVRVIVDAQAGVSTWKSADGGDTWTQLEGMSSTTVTEFAKYAKYLGKELRMKSGGSQDATIDNVNVWKIERSTSVETPSVHIVNNENPELVITEVVTCSTAKDSQAYHTLSAPGTGYDDAQAGTLMAAVDEQGNYILPADETVSLGAKTTRYEHLEIYNSGNTTVDLTNYTIAHLNTTVANNSMINAITGASTYARIMSGKVVVTDEADGISWQYYNAPEDCILRPGETAILFVPNNWMFSTPTFGHVNAFKQYVLIDEYGMDPAVVENMKILTLYDSLDYTYDKYGKSNYANVTNGFGINNSGISTIGIVKDIVDEDGNFVEPYVYENRVATLDSFKDQLVSYVVDAAVPSTPANNPVGSVFVGTDGHAGHEIHYGYGEEYTYWDAQGNFIPGGKLIQKSEYVARTTGSVPAAYANPNVDATKGGVNEAQWVGSQNTVAVDGKAEFRLVASIANVDDAKNIGFYISVNGGAEKKLYLKNYYESITTDFGAGIYTPETGYVVALNITAVPVDTTFTVKAFTVDANGLEMVGAAKTVTYVAN